MQLAVALEGSIRKDACQIWNCVGYISQSGMLVLLRTTFISVMHFLIILLIFICCTID